MTQTLATPQNNADVTSTGLQLLFMADGSHNDTWGELANENLLLLEQALCGVSTIDLSQVAAGATLALTNDQQRPGILIFTGALAGNVVIETSGVPRRWMTVNDTTGAFSLVLGATGGTGVVLPQGAATSVFCDGTNVALPTVDTVPIGTVSDWAGVELPNGKYAWANGQQVSRATYPALMAAITRQTTATVGGGQTLLPCTEDLTSRNIIGAPVEGVGIPANTAIVSVGAGNINLSQPTTGAATARTVTIFPWGNGDGGSTFTLPDFRERARVGAATMGGTGANGASGGAASNLNKAFGEANHTLSIPEMPAHGHGIGDPGHVHGTNEVPHSHTYTKPVILNATSGSSRGSSDTTTDTTSAVKTGLSVTAAFTGVVVYGTGGDQAHNNLPPTIVCNVIIRAL